MPDNLQTYLVRYALFWCGLLCSNSIRAQTDSLIMGKPDTLVPVQRQRGVWLKQQAAYFFEYSGWVWRGGITQLYQGNIPLDPIPPAALGYKLDVQYKLRFFSIGCQMERGLWQQGANFNTMRGYAIGPTTEFITGYVSFYIPIVGNTVELRSGLGESNFITQPGLFTKSTPRTRRWIAGTGAATEEIRPFRYFSIQLTINRYAWLGFTTYEIRTLPELNNSQQIRYESFTMGLQFGTKKGAALDNMFDTTDGMHTGSIQLRMGRSFFYNIDRGAAAVMGLQGSISSRIYGKMRIFGDINTYTRNLGQNVNWDDRSDNSPLNNYFTVGMRRFMYEAPHSIWGASAGVNRFVGGLRPAWGAHLGLDWESQFAFANLSANRNFSTRNNFITFQIGFQVHFF
jgi:hypothetical protein